MSYSINTVTISGNLTRDPESRTTNSGTVITKLSVAVAGREKVNGEWQDRPDYFDVDVFGAMAERAAEWLFKGAHVEIAGRLRQDRWEDKDGNKRYAVKVVANDVVFPRKGEGGTDGGRTHGNAAGGRTAANDDDFSAQAKAAFGAAGMDTMATADDDDDLPF